jgi:hypothetical protein
VDRTADGTETIRIDITMQKVLLAFDIGSIEIGWINFQSGAAPSFDMVPYGQSMPARPDRNHKAGFRSKLWDGRAGFSREFSSTAGATVNLASTAYVHSGADAVSYASTSSYRAFAPYRPTASTNTSPFTNLRFWVNGERTGGQQLAIEVRFSTAQTWGPLVPIDPMRSQQRPQFSSRSNVAAILHLPSSNFYVRPPAQESQPTR